MSESRTPIILLDLNAAAHSIAMLTGCANDWIPEEECSAIASELRPHFSAMADIFHKYAERHAELLKLCYEHGISEIVRMELLDLEHHLRGRTATGPGDPFALTHVSTWRAPDVHGIEE